MKPQDAVFFLVVTILLWKRSSWLPYVGIGCFVLAMPLFSQWIFFPAERLTWYGTAYILLHLLISAHQDK